MTTLHSLIRLKKHELDEVRRAVADLEERGRKLARQRETLEAEITREKEAAAQDAAARHSLEGYLTAVRHRRAGLERAQTALQAEIEAANERLARAFAELKKFELTQAERDRQARLRAKKREDQMFDEIALETHRRGGGAAR